MTKTAHTPGPWSWFGNAGSNSVYLATTHSGRRFVMDFTRWGFRGAQPRFQTERGVMIDAKDLLQFEVGDQSIVGVEAAKNDTSVYRYDVRGIASADACLIAAAPDLFDVLKSILPEIDAEIEQRQSSGNDEYWQGLQALSDAGHAAIAKAGGQP